ncbi:hypothetical protein ACF073_26160 [Streptomyces sp. NPDC015171]|uniref:hypothetical protein n=1 Tax=Streptomyces sp. NPDC015171 TaxID=3364945 RepID=UPI0036FCD293
MLRTTTWTRGRRGAVTAASAAVVCLGGVLAACGGGPGGGYTAVGAGRGGPTAVAPSGSVTMVPLDGAKGDAKGGGRPPRAANSAAPPSGSAGSADPGSSAPSPAAEDGTGRAPDRTPGTGTPPRTPEPGGGGEGGRTTPPAGSPGPPSGPPAPTASAGPAELSWGAPATEDTDKRWCQRVTVGLRNSGGTAVRSGEVTFGTHIIGALGVDWGTFESTAGLPVPLAPGARESPAWTVCVDAWRVPLGMHIETRDVSVEWD